MIKLLLLSDPFQWRIIDLLALETDEKNCIVCVFNLWACLR